LDAAHEAELIERAGRGDRSALSELFRIHQPRLVRLVKLRLDPALKRRLDPADVVQEAWVEILDRFAEWHARQDVSFLLWLRLTTRQTLAGVERRNLGTIKRAAQREVRDCLACTSVSATSVADALVASTTSPIHGAEREELRSRVLAALESLDEIDREIVALRQFESLSNEEAAAELSIQPAAASKRFTRALLRLRPHLDSLSSMSE
jgi:RNA polymerase sigma-70 factor (ECF subfamily)